MHSVLTTSPLFACGIRYWMFEVSLGQTKQSEKYGRSSRQIGAIVKPGVTGRGRTTFPKCCQAQIGVRVTRPCLLENQIRMPLGIVTLLGDLEDCLAIPEILLATVG